MPQAGWSVFLCTKFKLYLIACHLSSAGYRLHAGAFFPYPVRLGHSHSYHLNCRIVVYSPQIIENYQLQSGEGLSLTFVCIWLLGDITSLCGATLAHLLPTMILLAVYARARKYSSRAIHLTDVLTVHTV